MSDDHTGEEPLIVCDLEEELSIDELHTVKAALSGAGFVLEENLSKGRIEIYRPGPDDTIELPDEYHDRITEEIDAAMKSFKKKLKQLADQTESHGEGLTEQEQDLIELSRKTDSIPADEAREQLGLSEETEESDTEGKDTGSDRSEEDSATDTEPSSPKEDSGCEMDENSEDSDTGDAETFTIEEFRDLPTADRADHIKEIVREHQPVSAPGIAEHLFGKEVGASDTEYKEVHNRLYYNLKGTLEKDTDEDGSTIYTLPDEEKESDPGKNRQGTRQPETVTQA